MDQMQSVAPAFVLNPNVAASIAFQSLGGFCKNTTSACPEIQPAPEARAHALLYESIAEDQNISNITTGPVLKRVPKASRLQAANTLTDLLTNTTSNSIPSWVKLFSFASSCLAKPPRSGKKSPTLATIVNKQLQAFSKNETSIRVSNGRKKKNNNSTSIAALVSSKIADGDVRGAVRIASSEDIVLPTSEEVAMKLRIKHPDADPDSCNPEGPSVTDDYETLMITTNDVSEAISRFNNGSSGGPDRLRPQHLKDLTQKTLGETSSKLLTAIAAFGNEVVLRGRIPEVICPIFYGATLIGLSKPYNGVRPIAIGNTLRRLYAKICSRKLAELYSPQLRPHQVGVGTPLGAEIAVHGCRRFVTHASSHNKVIVKIDFSNAFNSLRRDLVLQTIMRIAPQVYPFIWQAYAVPSILSFGQHKLLSKEGVQQGDPLGPLMFCLTIQNLVQSCNSELNLWYLDDGTIGGDPNTVFEDFRRIKEAEVELGLHINPSKCELIVLSNDLEYQANMVKKFKELSPDIILVHPENMTLLGTPILDNSIESMLEVRLVEIKCMCNRLINIDAHDALVLLKNCFAIPKIKYFLRTAPCFKSQKLLEYDQALQSGLEAILNNQLKSECFVQSTLPISLGGLGVRTASSLALPAFLASSIACQPFLSSLLPMLEDIHSPTAIELQAQHHWRCLVGPEEQIPSSPFLEKAWDLPLCKAVYKALLCCATTDRDKARILAGASDHAGDWLKALPIPSLGLKLDDSQLRIACSLRLGTPLCHPHTCLCGKEVDSSGTHGLSCRKSAGRISRHSQVNDLIKRGLTSANTPAILEPLGISRNDGKRPDGMTIFPWKCGRLMVWDFTCCDTTAPSLLPISSKSAGKVAEDAETRKLSKYSDLNNTYDVIPVGAETLGPLGTGAVSLVEEIGRRIFKETNEPRSTAYLFQAISVAIQRGNAASVFGTVSRSETLEELFLL